MTERYATRCLWTEYAMLSLEKFPFFESSIVIIIYALIFLFNSQIDEVQND